MSTWAYCEECRKALPCPWVDTETTPRQKMFIVVTGEVDCPFCGAVYTLDKGTREMLFDEVADKLDGRLSLVERILKMLQPKIEKLLNPKPSLSDVLDKTVAEVNAKIASHGVPAPLLGDAKATSTASGVNFEKRLKKKGIPPDVLNCMQQRAEREAECDLRKERGTPRTKAEIFRELQQDYLNKNA